MTQDEQMRLEMMELIKMNEEANDLENDFRDKLTQVTDKTIENSKLLGIQGQQINNIDRTNDRIY